MKASRENDLADVCLVLEGTYPYVSGGVSTWVHQIISAIPDLRFSVLFIGADRDAKAQYRYQLPENVISVDEVYLFDRSRFWLKAPVTPAAIAGLLQKCRVALAAEGSKAETGEFAELFSEAASLAKRASIDAIWKDSALWDLVSGLYNDHCDNEPFLDFFWACRFLAEPVWNLLGSLHRAPKAKLYHSPSTGYAGVVAALAAKQHGAPFLLSEHGIYVRERIAEIHKAAWLHDAESVRPKLLPEDSVLRTMWIRFFALLARFSYESAGHITTLFAANAEQQVDFGAPREKIEVIPNGISLQEFDEIARQRRDWLAKREHPVVGFLGRVVAIKDVKTLLHAAAGVHREVPSTRFLIAGPNAEEPEYFRECQALVDRLGLRDAVDFPGAMDRADVLGEIDVMVLTSVSEGLPFVVLEAFGAGVPLVLTDVGACSELIHGQAGETPAFGAAGIVTRVGDSQAIAQGLMALLNDPDRKRAMGDAGRARVQAHYTQDAVVGRFRALYSKMAAPTGEPLNSHL